ncbi:unnamed protein product [Urochloa humidicola]
MRIADMRRQVSRPLLCAQPPGVLLVVLASTIFPPRADLRWRLARRGAGMSPSPTPRGARPPVSCARAMLSTLASWAVSVSHGYGLQGMESQGCRRFILPRESYSVGASAE